MAKDKLRLILGRVDPSEKKDLVRGQSLDLEHLLESFTLVDNIYDISKRRYLTRAEAKSFSELVARIESDLISIIFLEFSSLRNEIDDFIRLADKLLDSMRDFSERQSRIQHCHRIPIIDIPRLRAYHAIASHMKERLHSLSMEVDHVSMEGLRALRSDYFSMKLYNLGNMSQFAGRHLKDAVEMINSKNGDQSILSEQKDILRSIGSFTSIRGQRAEAFSDVKRLEELYMRTFENDDSLFTALMHSVSYSRHSVKDLAKIQHYLQNTVKEVEKKSKTRVPSKSSSRKKVKLLVSWMQKSFAGELKTVEASVSKILSMDTILRSLSGNAVASQIYQIPKEQHKVEFRSDDDEKALKRLFQKARKLADTKGMKHRYTYKGTSQSFSRTFKSSTLVLENSSFISFYEVGKEKQIRFVVVYGKSIIMGHGSSYDDMRLESFTGNTKEEVRGDYAENLSYFLDDFVSGTSVKDKEWSDEISGMLLSAWLESKGHVPDEDIFGAHDKI